MRGLIFSQTDYIKSNFIEMIFINLLNWREKTALEYGIKWRKKDIREIDKDSLNFLLDISPEQIVKLASKTTLLGASLYRAHH